VLKTFLQLPVTCCRQGINEFLEEKKANVMGNLFKKRQLIGMKGDNFLKLFSEKQGNIFEKC